MDSQPSLSQTSHRIYASRGKRSMRSKELVQLAGDLIRLALSAVSAECLSDLSFFLALPLSSYTALCRLMQRSIEHIHIQGYTSAPTERPCMCPLALSVFCIATPTSSLTATRAELYYFVVVIIHVREADE